MFYGWNKRDPQRCRKGAEVKELGYQGRSQGLNLRLPDSRPLAVPSAPRSCSYR